MRDMPGERGNVLSEDGSLLATSIPYFDVFWDATIAKRELNDKEIKQGLDSLSLYLAYYVQPQSTPGAWSEYLWQEMKNNSKYSMIAKGLTYEQMQMIKSFPIFRNGRFRSR